MKGLRKYLTPFAPDQSGAVSVLFELGGLIVICDAGGCAGNVCGFDEPRWFMNKSAVFSAGLRDMDAIMGRDDLLVKKLALCASRVEASFAAIIGTPVPAVIGTDYKALMRMAEKKTELPVLAIDTSGTNWFDKGEEKAWNMLLEKFTLPEHPTTLELTGRRVGVWGMTPLEMSSLTAGKDMQTALFAEGFEQVDCYGMGAGLDRIMSAGKADLNLVVAPAAYEAAKKLKEVYGTPFEIRDPLAAKKAKELANEQDFNGKKVLIVTQQVSAVTMRKELLAAGAQAVTCGTWFMEIDELHEEGDVVLREEENFPEFVAAHDFDVIITDPDLFPMIPEFQGTLIELPQFAVSGKMMNPTETIQVAGPGR